MSKVTFKLEKVEDNTGTPVDTLVKYVEGKEGEPWINIQELDKLFDTCVARWSSNWDLEKVLTAIREAEFD